MVLQYKCSFPSSRGREALFYLFLKKVPRLCRRPQLYLLSLLFIAGFYLWVLLSSFFLHLPTKKHPLFLYSTECRDDLLLLHCKALQNTKTSIHLTIYGLTDPHIINIINTKAEEGLSVSIFYDPSASIDLKEKLHSKVQAYPVNISGLMHRKILILDHKRIFLGSANMTPTSMQIHGNLVAGIRNRSLAKELEKEDFSHTQTLVENETLNTYFLPKMGKNALAQMKQMILSAEKSIYVAMFTLTHPELIEALKTAHQKGVKVRVAIDYYTSKGASQKAVKELQKAGISTFIGRSQKLLHHKWMWIDHNTLVFGSANWTKSAFRKNQDFIVMMTTQAVKQKKTMKKLWKVLHKEAQRQPAPL